MRIYICMCNFGDDECGSEYIEYASTDINKAMYVKNALEEYNNRLADELCVYSSNYYITYVDLDSLNKIGYLEKQFIEQKGKLRSPIFKEVNV